MDGHTANNSPEHAFGQARSTDTSPVGTSPPSQSAIPPDDGHSARGAKFWLQRKAAVAKLAEEAFRKTGALESNLTLLTNDLLSQLVELNEQLERALAQTRDPLDKLQLLRTCLPEANKTSREIRSLTEILTRTQGQRGHHAPELRTPPRPR